MSKWVNHFARIEFMNHKIGLIIDPEVQFWYKLMVKFYLIIDYKVRF